MSDAAPRKKLTIRDLQNMKERSVVPVQSRVQITDDEFNRFMDMVG